MGDQQAECSESRPGPGILRLLAGRSIGQRGNNESQLKQWVDTRFNTRAKGQWISYRAPGQIRSTMSLAFSSDGRYLASGHGDHTVKVVDLITGRCIHELSGHPRTPWTVCFHPFESNFLVSGCIGGSLMMWDVEMETCVARRTFEGYRVFSAIFNSLGSILAVSVQQHRQRGHSMVYIMNASTSPPRLSEPVVFVEDTTTSIRSISFHSSGRWLLTANTTERQHIRGPPTSVKVLHHPLEEQRRRRQERQESMRKLEEHKARADGAAAGLTIEMKDEGDSGAGEGKLSRMSSVSSLEDYDSLRIAGLPDSSMHALDRLPSPMRLNAGDGQPTSPLFRRRGLHHRSISFTRGSAPSSPRIALRLSSSAHAQDEGSGSMSRQMSPPAAVSSTQSATADHRPANGRLKRTADMLSIPPLEVNDHSHDTPRADDPMAASGSGSTGAADDGDHSNNSSGRRTRRNVAMLLPVGSPLPETPDGFSVLNGPRVFWSPPPAPAAIAEDERERLRAARPPSLGPLPGSLAHPNLTFVLSDPESVLRGVTQASSLSAPAAAGSAPTVASVLSSENADEPAATQMLTAAGAFDGSDDALRLSQDTLATDLATPRTQPMPSSMEPPTNVSSLTPANSAGSDLLTPPIVPLHPRAPEDVVTPRPTLPSTGAASTMPPPAPLAARLPVMTLSDGRNRATTQLGPRSYSLTDVTSTSTRASITLPVLPAGLSASRPPVASRGPVLPASPPSAQRRPAEYGSPLRVARRIDNQLESPPPGPPGLTRRHSFGSPGNSQGSTASAATSQRVLAAGPPRLAMPHPQPAPASLQAPYINLPAPEASSTVASIPPHAPSLPRAPALPRLGVPIYHIPRTPSPFHLSESAAPHVDMAFTSAAAANAAHAARPNDVIRPLPPISDAVALTALHHRLFYRGMADEGGRMHMPPLMPPPPTLPVPWNGGMTLRERIVSFHPRQTMTAVLKLWDYSSGTVAQEPLLEIYGAVVYGERGCALSPNGDLVAFCAADDGPPNRGYRLHVVSLRMEDFGQLLYEGPAGETVPPILSASLTSVQFSPTGQYVLLSFTTPAPLTRDNVPADFRPWSGVLHIHRVGPGMPFVRKISDGDVSVNEATYAPCVGFGMAYGTRTGTLRLYTLSGDCDDVGDQAAVEDDNDAMQDTTAPWQQAVNLDPLRVTRLALNTPPATAPSAAAAATAGDAMVTAAAETDQMDGVGHTGDPGYNQHHLADLVRIVGATDHVMPSMPHHDFDF